MICPFRCDPLATCAPSLWELWGNVTDNGGVKPRTTSRQLADLVERTVSALENARLPLEMPGSRELAESRVQLLTQLETRILPHLRTAELPAVVVLGGSSGAGKSTLFNSVLGTEISPASVLRPTTRTPIVAVHPDDAPILKGHALLKMGQLEVLDSALKGIVLVDAPDLDSVEAANRELSHRLLDAADMWVFVTTASRYGDAVAWRTLEDANTRGMTTAVVLNRVPDRSRLKIRMDLQARLAKLGLDEAPLLLVSDAGPHEGLLPEELIRPMREWLDSMANSHIGKALISRTTEAMFPALRTQLIELAEAVELQANSVQDLADRASIAAAQPIVKLTTNAKNGRYGQGAPTTSWLSFASTGATLASLAVGEAPVFFRRHDFAQRDGAITTVFDAVVSALRVGLQQGIFATDEGIQYAWREDIVETSEYCERGHAGVVVDEIVAETIASWKNDLLELTAGAPTNPWFGKHGLAALLGSAAGGVAGAEKALSSVKLQGALGPARDLLSSRLEEGIQRVVDSYRAVLDQIEVGNGRQLRVRASEYLDRV